MAVGCGGFEAEPVVVGGEHAGRELHAAEGDWVAGPQGRGEGLLRVEQGCRRVARRGGAIAESGGVEVLGLRKLDEGFERSEVEVGPGEALAATVGFFHRMGE